MSVFISAFSVTTHSLWVSAITDSNGGYTKDVLNIRQDPSNALNNNFDSALSYSKNDADASLSP